MSESLPLPELPAPTWTDDRKFWEDLARSIEPVARVTTKGGAGWVALWLAGAVLTLSAFAFSLPLGRFLREFATTFVVWIGFPISWPTLHVSTVVHECRHVRQATWFGWLVLPIAWSRTLRACFGTPIFAVVYLLLPLPIGFALGRVLLERDADAAGWRESMKRGQMSPSSVRTAAKSRAVSVSGDAYFYAAPHFLVHWLYSRAAEAVIAERLA